VSEGKNRKLKINIARRAKRRVFKKPMTIISISRFYFVVCGHMAHGS
jgi:hypothetical protein